MQYLAWQAKTMLCKNDQDVIHDGGLMEGLSVIRQYNFQSSVSRRYFLSLSSR